MQNEFLSDGAWTELKKVGRDGVCFQIIFGIAGSTRAAGYISRAWHFALSPDRWELHIMKGLSRKHFVSGRYGYLESNI